MYTNQSGSPWSFVVKPDPVKLEQIVVEFLALSALMSVLGYSHQEKKILIGRGMLRVGVVRGAREVMFVAGTSSLPEAVLKDKLAEGVMVWNAMTQVKRQDIFTASVTYRHIDLIIEALLRARQRLTEQWLVSHLADLVL